MVLISAAVWRTVCSCLSALSALYVWSIADATANAILLHVEVKGSTLDYAVLTTTYFHPHFIGRFPGEPGLAGSLAVFFHLFWESCHFSGNV